MKISIGSDHAGFELKSTLTEYLKQLGIEVFDVGTHSSDSTDYPPYAHEVCTWVLQNKTDFGIVICGSGNGVNMSANRHAGIRSALCWMPEIAVLARQHNNANILALPARYISISDAKKCIDAFLHTNFEGGRHEKRVQKIELS